MLPHPRLRVYVLNGRHTVLVWCRDAALLQVMFGSVVIGDGAITIGCGHVGTGVRPRTGTATLIGVMTVIGAEASVPNATTAFMPALTESMDAGNR